MHRRTLNCFIDLRLSHLRSLKKRHVLPGGHNLHYEVPAELSALALNWLQGL